MSGVFEEIIKPSINCIPVLEVIHSEWHEGEKFRVTQSVNSTVFNDFDGKLSKHLAATKGTGFPNCRVTVQIVNLRGTAEPRSLEPSYHDSTSHALMRIAKLAFTRVGAVELVLQRGDCRPGQILPVCHRRMIDAPYIARFEQALGICDYLGATAFLRLSGEFDLLEITPPGGLDPVIFHLRKGTVEVPSLDGPKKSSFEWKITEFAEYASTNVTAQGYLARIRQAIMTEKEAAILAFHAEAERKIDEFDRALAGRKLDGHWLACATSLIARLKAGLGPNMTGLSEDARGRVLDWCSEIQRTRKTVPLSPAKRSANGVPRALPSRVAAAPAAVADRRAAASELGAAAT